MTLTEKILANFLMMFRMMSTYGYTALFSAAGWYYNLGDEGRKAFTAEHAILAKQFLTIPLGLWLLGITWLVLKVWPQPAVTQTALKMEAADRQVK